MATRLKAPTTSRLTRPGGLRPPGSVATGIATPPAGPPAMAAAQRASLAGRRPANPPQVQSLSQVPDSSSPQQLGLEVGDRVLLGGTKPGTVAFVGHTQFAKGVWAGLVLDTPEGKNDGSVAGVAYFHCAPNHGVFSRPEKLTRLPKPVSTARPIPPQPSPPHPGNYDDGFAIGDRILVDGTKPGVVEFVGPTQFAKGMWVGIALDSAEGKNSGQVAGVQYFECAPLHGIFTRPAKLTLVERPPQRRPPPAAVAAVQRARTAVTDPIRPPPQRTGSSSVNVDELKAKADEMSVGDRVIVSGVKVGTIRYLGLTDFAKGLWVGVELDGPEGKNDGSVSGKRYFQCQPSHGLFAPLPKVEKLPQPTGPAAGREGRISGASTSSLNSPARVGLHSVPTQHLVQEPDPLSPVGSDMGSTGSLTHIMFEKDHQIATLQSSVEQLEEDKHKLLEQVTSLQRRVDDLQFQLEEQAIISRDELEEASSREQEELSQLKTDLQLEKEKTSSLTEQLKQQQQYLLNQTDGGGLGEEERKELMKQLTEKEAEVVKVRGECDRVHQDNASLSSQLTDSKQQLAVANQKIDKLSAKSAELEGQLSLMSTDSSQLTDSLQQQLQDKERSLTETHEEVAKLSLSLQQMTNQLQSVKVELQSTEGAAGGIQDELESNRQRLQEALELCAQRGEVLDERNAQVQMLDEQKRRLEQELQSLNSEQERLEKTTQQLISERDNALARCDRLMAESSSASSEQEQLAQQRKDLLYERDQYRSDYSAAQLELERVTHERDELQRRLTEIEADLRGQSQEISLKYNSVQGQLDETQSQLIRHKEEVAHLQSQLEQQKISHQQQIEMAQGTCIELKGRLDAAVDERETTMQQAQELADKLTAANAEKEQLQQELSSSAGQLDELQSQLDDVMASHHSLQQASASESSLVQQELEETQALLENKDRELQAALEKVNELSEELVIKSSSSDTKRMAALEEDKLTLEEEKVALEEEKVSLEEEVASLRTQLVSAKAAASSGPTTVTEEMEKMRETITTKEQEVEFLNSVIVDLQAKVDALEALNGLGDQHEVLEYIDQVDDDLPPPRLFCDICDEFDLHDTDDCPLQAQSDSPPQTMYHGRRGNERPYCDKCEVFGHWTEDCEYEETY